MPLRFLSKKRGESSDRYVECPVCRYGTLTELVMMEALSCDFCRHIFSVDAAPPLVQLPVLKLEDAAQPLKWQWTGQRWKAFSEVEQHLIIWLWVVCVAIVALPSSLMGIATQLFPTTPHSHGAWIASLWLPLTFGSHLALSLWLLAEHYQWSFYLRLKLLFQRGIPLV